MDTSSLAHTKWNCKYHIVFAPRQDHLLESQQRQGEMIIPSGDFALSGDAGLDRGIGLE